MQIVPDSAGMIEAVAEWLEDAAGAALNGVERYNARVAARALRGVERELRSGTAYFEPDRTSLRGFATHVDEHDDDAMLRSVATRIREGRLGASSERLVEVLHAYTVRRLLLVNPGYLIAADRTEEPARGGR